MGFNQSKAKINALERQQISLMKQSADMAKQLKAQEEASNRQYKTTFEQMTAILSAVAQSKASETIINDEKSEIEIAGTTYEILQYVNRGGFGTIFKAKVKSTGRIVAIKVLENTPGIEAEIKNEINFLRVTKRISIDNHPIIEYRGSRLTKEGIFIAMEFALCDLHTFWKNKKFHAIEEITVFGMIIIVYVLRALAFLEKLNIIHGDIKPQNMVLVPNKQYFCIKLIDFGSAEKMNTQRTQLTVDADKVHTAFFVSPEFLRYDSKSRISRKLHKASDVWAAGVMFYLLFCNEFPWSDERAYRNFCNDQNASDVVVPEAGGYRKIIELLLKKNPDERASAKQTLIQLRAHPEFGKIVESLHQNFCPVDDVCHMTVPDDVREELMKLARPGHYTGSFSCIPSEAAATGPRQSCRYGQQCYRTGRDHLDKFAHPGDLDYHESPISKSGHTENQACRYGVYCYQKDREHLSKYSHTDKSTCDHPDKNKNNFATSNYRQHDSTQMDEDVTIKPSLISVILSTVTLVNDPSKRDKENTSTKS